ncbi:hypothetical protein [Sphingomonas sanguinis]|uniref:hypothetical protein n=1 Tax=Sphingomonas sanguinis TaxID=33051 RepID=UPI003016647A
MSLIQNFFETILLKIKAGDNAEAEALLGQLREPNETHLGLSRGRSRGRALGDGSAHDVWGALSRSEAAKTGMVQDLEDTVLLIPKIGVDIVSDVTTNIIRMPLIEYTQEQCRQLGIPLQEGVPSGPLWNPASREWFSKYVELPMTAEGKLLLVPKAIVRRTPLYDMNEYYRHYLLEHMQKEEIKAGSSLVKMVKKAPKVHKTDLIEKYGGDKKAVVAQTFKYPSILEEYKRDKRDQPFMPLSHEDLEGVEQAPATDWDGLLMAVRSLPTGAEVAASYEKAIESLLTALFYPDLNHPIYQPEIHDGRKRLDIKYTNMAMVGFFSWLSKHYMAPEVFVECKNYGNEVANPELDQLSGRFGRSRGEFGIIVCRNFKNKALFQKRCRDTALDGRGYIIALDDDDLTLLVESRKADINEYRQWSLLRQRFDFLLS